MTAEPAWDDPSIPNDDQLFRGILRRPDFSVPDLITGKLLVKPAALQLDPDGMSTQRESLLCRTEVTRGDLYDWDKYSGVEFPVAAVRSTGDAGVVDEPDADDERLGAAHALVRPSAPYPARAIWREVRSMIAAVCEWMPEDPNRPPPA